MNIIHGKQMATVVFGLCLTVSATFAIANGMHPDVPLLDVGGQPVVNSGLPVSTMVTCGGDCHDTGYIAASSDHADAGASQLGSLGQQHEWQVGRGYYGGWNPLAYDSDGLDGSGEIDTGAWLKRFGSRHVGGGPADGMVEMDCLMCHVRPDPDALRGSALATGEFTWANSMRFADTGALESVDGQWRWVKEKFQNGGALLDGLLEIRKPADENCAQCHGQIENSLDEPLTIASDRSQRHNTERSGQLISPQKLLNSGLNIAGKESKAYPFDVHSDRVVGCVNCHYSLNNPVYFRQREESRPAHLEFDPRRLTSADYLKRPLHQFAKGQSTLGLAAVDSETSMRRCESCHDAGSAHQWLPYRERHFLSLACETCHVPRLYGPALESIDWTMLNPEGEPSRTYRGFDGDPVATDTLSTGFQPALLPREDKTGQWKLAPYNLVASWYWTTGEPRMPATRAQLKAAFFENGAYHPDLVAALDLDGNRQLEGDELRLLTADSVDVVRGRLEQSGLSGLQMHSEITPFAISHNVVNGRQAIRECTHCHGRDSALAAAFPLAANPPGALVPELIPFEAMSFSGKVVSGGNGALSFVPDSRQAGFYIIGLHAENWADALGLLMFFGVAAGVTGHALARYFANRRRTPTGQAQQRVYMYDAYERLWHWLQASAILLLLFTGLIIHKPHVFGIFSFPYVVNVHNVLGFILLINAALALFYNLASGEIRQYLPRPKGFVGRSIAQAMYYSRGIFAGQPHPFEKSRDQKLNPLQQVTYLAILNVLLPAQVITGVLIWGLQKWPGIAASLGGLPALALVHTLVAWAFAAFIVMHVYLTTAAGHTPGAGIRAMIEGWDEVDMNEAEGVTRIHGDTGQKGESR
jgi:thiosulfate reductase cytochrome b subunit